MSIFATLKAALAGLAGGRIFPGVAPENTATPYITYQIVGGGAINYLENTDPHKGNARVQINIWDKSSLNAIALANTAENTLRATAALQTTVLSAAIDTYDPETKYRGTRQDFSLWYDK